MNKNNTLDFRLKKRHNHVFIRLRIKRENKWVWIKARHWNEVGFNFTIDQNINESTVQLRKGKDRFTGEIVWSQSGLNNSDDVYMEVILNTLLYKKTEQLGTDNHSVGNIIKLIRCQGRQDDKLKLLFHLGINISKTKLNALIEKGKNDCTVLHKYGVKVESTQWSGVVKQTLESSSEFDNIDKMLEDLAGMLNSK